MKSLMLMTALCGSVSLTVLGSTKGDVSAELQRLSTSLTALNRVASSDQFNLDIIMYNQGKLLVFFIKEIETTTNLLKRAKNSENKGLVDGLLATGVFAKINAVKCRDDDKKTVVHLQVHLPTKLDLQDQIKEQALVTGAATYFTK